MRRTDDGLLRRELPGNRSQRFLWFWLLPGWTVTSAAMAIAQGSNGNTSARAEHVKATLHHILSEPEFNPGGKTENAITRALRWLGDQWQNFKQMLRHLWNALFGVAAALHGTPALQWIFIVAFLVLGAFVLFRLIRNLIHVKRQVPRVDHRPQVEKEPPTESLDPAEWMERARLAALEKDYRAAYRALYRATLLQLNRAALISYDPARTNREVLSSLDQTQISDIRGELEDFTQAFEQRWFGFERTDSSDYQDGVKIAAQIQQWTSDKDKTNAAS